jgi:hypothetical protein
LVTFEESVNENVDGVDEGDGGEIDTEDDTSEVEEYDSVDGVEDGVTVSV